MLQIRHFYSNTFFINNNQKRVTKKSRPHKKSRFVYQFIPKSYKSLQTFLRFFVNYFLYCRKKFLYGFGWFRRVKQAIWNTIIPFYGNYFQKRVNICPARNSQQHIISIFSAVKNIHIVKIKIYNMNLIMILPKFISQLVYIITPIPAH